MDTPLSEAALSLLKVHLADQGPRVTEENREAHRELAAAGLMIPLHTFAWGRESRYRLTEKGISFLASPASLPAESSALRG